MPIVFNPGANTVANTIVAGPASGADAPATSRTMVTDDIPALGVTTAKIAATAITAAKMAASSVDLASSTVTGLLPVANQDYAYRSISAPATLAANDQIIVDTSGGNAITFPTTVGVAGKRYTISNIGGTADTLTPQASEYIGGLATFSLAAGAFASFVSNGAVAGNWVQIG